MLRQCINSNGWPGEYRGFAPGFLWCKILNGSKKWQLIIIGKSRGIRPIINITVLLNEAVINIIKMRLGLL
ncbi:hypothetical protein D3C75_1016020 [compost metagenome]